MYISIHNLIVFCFANSTDFERHNDRSTCTELKGKPVRFGVDWSSV